MISYLTLEEVMSLIPKRDRKSSKHDYGRLMAVCGSAYYRGAAFLSCKAALRCGAGIVTLASTERVISSVAGQMPECTFLPLRESENGTIGADNADFILENAKKCQALLIGCGLAIDGDTKVLVKRIVEAAECQLIIDADGLNVLAECPEIISKAKKIPIITPHFGEMARLSKVSRTDIESVPEESAMAFAKKYNCITVLKSHTTYIATPDGKMAVNNKYGNPGLARGGSGDVLAGMIGAFCAQGIAPFESSKCGVCLHGASADRCAARLSEQSMLPSDILDDLCNIFAEK